MKKPEVTVTISSSTTLSLEELLKQFDAAVPHYVKPPQEHKIFHLIGTVAAEWSYLEHVLDRIIWSLADTISARTACITAQILGATNRYKTIIAQLHLRGRTEPQLEKYIETVNVLMQKSYGVQERRNRIVHDAWYVDNSKSDQPAQYKKFAHKDLRFGINPIDFDDIQKTIADIGKLTEKANDLFEAINAETSLRKRRAALPESF